MRYPNRFRKGARKTRKPASKRPTVRKAIARVKKTSFKKKVLAVVREQAESKQAYHSVTSQSIRNQCSASTDIYQIIPSIANGVSDNQRIGDQIKLQSVSIKGYLRLPIATGVNQSYNRRIALRMMIVKPKRYNSLDDIKTNATSWLPTLLKKGGSTVGFTGAISDLWAPINTDSVTKYYDKIVYLREDQVMVSGATVPNTGVPYTLTSEGTVKFFTINKYFNKTIKYDSGSDSGLLPTNWEPVMIVGLVYLNGDSTTGTTEAYVSYDTIMNYEDN